METDNFYRRKYDAVNMFWAFLIWLIFHDIVLTSYKIFWINEIKSQGKTSLVIFLM